MKKSFFLILGILLFCKSLFGQSYNNVLFFPEIEKHQALGLEILGIHIRYPLELTWSDKFQSQNLSDSAFSLSLTPMKYSLPTPKKVSSTQEVFNWFELNLQNSVLPHFENNLTNPLQSRTYGLLLSYTKGEINFFLNFLTNLGSRYDGHTFFKNSLTQLGLRFPIKPYNPLYLGLHVGLQQVDFQQWDEKLKKTDLKPKINTFLTSGLAIGAKTFVIEGLVRLPIYNYGNENDQLLKPEFQGRLGLKWNLPETIKP